MDLNQAAPSRRKAFSFTEYLEEGILEAYSCGNGRFISGTPGANLEVCFRLHKTRSFLDIQIYDDNLLHWLRAIPSLRDDLDNGRFRLNMGLLLPRYPEIRVKFDQDKRGGHSFDALELFVRHFLREGSVFATFGFEHLHEEQILTELHFHDIQSQYRSMSEDLDLLDEAIDELDERDIKGSSHPSPPMNETFRSQLRAAIRQRDPIAVDTVLALDSGFVDAKTLCLAIRYYHRTIFHLLLKHGAQADGVDVITEPLYRAAKAGHMDAVRLLLSYGANKEGGDFCISATPLTGAASGGHLEIVQYLVEEKGANIDGNRYKSPLSRAIKHRHRHIVDYLLRAGANLLKVKNLEFLSQLVETNQAVYGDILERFIAGMDDDARDLLFLRAASNGHLEIVRYLVAAGAYVDPGMRHRYASGKQYSPLVAAASNGQIDIVRYLVAVGANVNPDMRHRDASNKQYSPLAAAASNGHLEIVRYLVAAGADVNPDMRHRDASNTQYSPLAAAASNRRSEVAHFLSSVGATLLEGEDKIRVLHSFSAVFPFTPYYTSVGEILETIKDPKHLDDYGRIIWPEMRHHSAATDVEDCPAVAAIQAQERRTMARRLLAKVANSHEKLLDAGTRQDASARLIAFVGQVGTNSSVWRSGTRAIRDIGEGYMPRSLSDIVSALQVANAMRSAVPPSELVCSKKNFVNDIPRWAALLRPDDQPLFFEIASYLWGIPASTTAQEGAGSFARPLMFLQCLVIRLVRASGLFDHGSGNSCGSYRLQTLRQQHRFVTGMRCTHTGERRLPLAEWRPLPTPEVQESLHTDAPKPPDPEGEHFSILARITVLMAGAIFGAILLYLCLSQYGFSTIRLPALTSDAGQGWASDQIMTRNCVILAMYMGFTSLVDSESWKSTDHLLPKPSPLSLVLPDGPRTEGVQEHMAAVQSCYEGDCTMMDSPSTVDTITEDALADCSPTLSSHLTTSPSATTISPFTIATATPCSTITGTSENGTICCEYCKSKFKLGKNGRRGQASNLQKHMKNHHPETIPNYQREIYECSYGCRARDPNKSNIEAHEKKHCAIRKGKQPRRHGKWREATTGTS